MGTYSCISKSDLKRVAGLLKQARDLVDAKDSEIVRWQTENITSLVEIGKLRDEIARKDAALAELRACQTCSGTGEFQGGRMTLQKPLCPDCKGTGTNRSHVKDK